MSRRISTVHHCPAVVPEQPASSVKCASTCALWPSLKVTDIPGIVVSVVEVDVTSAELLATNTAVGGPNNVKLEMEPG